MAAKKKSVSKGKIVGVGLASAAAVAAAGTYFLYGSNHAKRNRQKVKSWVLKAKAEALEGLEKAKSMSEDDYKKIVSAAVKKYNKVAAGTEVKKLERELHSHWKHLVKGSQSAQKTAKKTKSVVRKASKKAARQKK